MLHLAVFATLAGLASAGAHLSNLRHASLDVATKKQELRVCNACPSDPLSVVYEGNELTQDESVDYKKCRSFDVSVKSGEKIKVLAGNETDNKTGIFTVWEVPKCDAVLLLVAHRREDAKNTVSFSSHAFCPTKTAQVAVIDTSNKKSPIDMSVAELNTKAAKVEKLSFNTAIGLAPGSYKIIANSGNESQQIEFEAHASESYVVFRTGWASAYGDSVPEELVVYPAEKVSHKAKEETHDKEETEKKDEKSGAYPLSASMFFVSVVMCLMQ